MMISPWVKLIKPMAHKSKPAYIPLSPKTNPLFDVHFAAFKNANLTLCMHAPSCYTSQINKFYVNPKEYCNSDGVRKISFGKLF